jgi:L-asparaginase / beta-aspartyl-peptidase
MQPKLIVHGGAWVWPDERDSVLEAGLEAAIHAGWAILQAGGHALDAVEASVRVMEDLPQFNAGTGSLLNAAGIVEMDALIADGASLDFGAVAGVQRVRHPISLARRVLADTPHCFFAGPGADGLAMMLGEETVPNLALVSEAELRNFRERRSSEGGDTVGAVALDAVGNLVAGTSTGGTPHKMPGRVGDSPIFGSGGYADNALGAASATGKGEEILRVLLCRTAVEFIARGLDAQAAADAARDTVVRRLGADVNVGLILIDRRGGFGAIQTTPKMATAWVDADGRVRTCMAGPRFDEV